MTWTLPRSFAGNIGVNRAGHPNNTLYFWGFEKENGSLTAGADERANEPWGIWLNGGLANHHACQSDGQKILTPVLRRPGSSSLIGLTSEVGAPS